MSKEFELLKLEKLNRITNAKNTEEIQEIIEDYNAKIARFNYNENIDNDYKIFKLTNQNVQTIKNLYRDLYKLYQQL
tara:strand:- start:1452 stop:1682 length:231 start_codon:yes stop_codon:yes gene_type:complete